MKITNIALHAVLAVIGTASRASAKGFFRGSVEEREDVRRETMGDQVHPKYLDKCADGLGKPGCETCGELIANEMAVPLPNVGADGLVDIKSNAGYMKACSAVAEAHIACLGCQGYELEGELSVDPTKGIVHIPGCVGMTLAKCQALAQSIVDDHLDWFPPGTGRIGLEQRQVTSTHDMRYWNLALPVTGTDTGLAEGVLGQKIKGLAGDCMVYYPWTWCLEVSTGNTQCTNLAPFDCSVGENGSNDCLTAKQCCGRIQGVGEGSDADGMARYMYPDVNDNKLQCYAWGVDTPAGGGQGDGGVGGGAGDVIEGGLGLRVIIHLSSNLVALPAVITAKEDFIVKADRSIAPVFHDDNLNKWQNDEPVSKRGIDIVNANHDLWRQDSAGAVTGGVGYVPGL